MIRVLLAHSEPTLRQHFARMLADAGHEVIAVDRGTDALPLLVDEHFDLLLADLVMPEMDGIELAQRCAGLSPATRIMYLNGFSTIPLERPRSRGALPACGRPFHVRHLAEEIEERLPAFLAPAVGRSGRLPAWQQTAKGSALPGEPG